MCGKNSIFTRTIALVTLWIFLPAPLCVYDRAGFSNVSFALRPAAFKDRPEGQADEVSISFTHGKFVVDFCIQPLFITKPPSIQQVRDRLIQLLDGSQENLLQILPITGESGVYLSCRGNFFEGYKIVGSIDPERNKLKFGIYRNRKDNILHAEDEFVTGIVKYAPTTPVAAAPVSQPVGVMVGTLVPAVKVPPASSGSEIMPPAATPQPSPAAPQAAAVIVQHGREAAGVIPADAYEQLRKVNMAQHSFILQLGFANPKFQDITVRNVLAVVGRQEGGITVDDARAILAARARESDWADTDSSAVEIADELLREAGTPQALARGPEGEAGASSGSEQPAVTPFLTAQDLVKTGVARQDYEQEYIERIAQDGELQNLLRSLAAEIAAGRITPEIAVIRLRKALWRGKIVSSHTLADKFSEAMIQKVIEKITPSAAPAPAAIIEEHVRGQLRFVINRVDEVMPIMSISDEASARTVVPLSRAAARRAASRCITGIGELLRLTDRELVEEITRYGPRWGLVADDIMTLMFEPNFFIDGEGLTGEIERGAKEAMELMVQELMQAAAAPQAMAPPVKPAALLGAI